LIVGLALDELDVKVVGHQVEDAIVEYNIQILGWIYYANT
jgi:hypothetical protein